MLKFIQFVLLIIGGYCLYIAYQFGYHPNEGFEIATSEPACYITEMFIRMFDVRIKGALFYGVDDLKQLKNTYLISGLVLIFGCGGVLFSDIGGSKSSDD